MRPSSCSFAAVLACLAGCDCGAFAQSSQRAAFIGNNGNIEGSVTSYTFSPAGVPQFVAKFIMGSGSGNAGNNVTGITLTPNGKYLATLTQPPQPSPNASRS